MNERSYRLPLPDYPFHTDPPGNWKTDAGHCHKQAAYDPKNAFLNEGIEERILPY
jgi:hypothetical protein